MANGTIACERCGVPAGLVSTVAPFGSAKGARIYGCPECRHFTWSDWHGSAGGQEQQQQQQQLQPDRKDDSK
jgi:hypothetical protein